MGITVNAQTIARLVHRHERVVRGWIERGALKATKIGSAPYLVDIDDLKLVKVRGVVIDKDLLKKIEAGQSLDAPDIDVINELRKEIAELRRRVEALERQKAVMSVREPVETSPRTFTPSTPSYTPYKPDTSSLSSFADTSQSKETYAGVVINYFEGQVSKGTAAKLGVAHGMSANAAERKVPWTDNRPTPADVVTWIIGYMTRPGAVVKPQPCGFEDCVCRDLLLHI
jgi:hypothetical protein